MILYILQDSKIVLIVFMKFSRNLTQSSNDTFNRFQALSWYMSFTKWRYEVQVNIGYIFFSSCEYRLFLRWAAVVFCLFFFLCVTITHTYLRRMWSLPRLYSTRGRLCKSNFCMPSLSSCPAIRFTSLH